MASKRLREAKKQVFYALEDLPRAQGVARFFGIVLLILIVANALLVGTDVTNAQDSLSLVFVVFGIISTAVFTVEYILRLWVADLVYPTYSSVGARFRYVRSLLGIVDLLSFLPIFFIWIIPYSAAFVDAVRIIRVIRLVKVSRYMRGLKTIGIVFKTRQREIVAAFMVVALVCIASSVLMYEAEHAVQPEQFDSVLTGIYWAMTTMTSTGYGDLVPITPAGRFIGFITMVLSIGVIAIPAGIFSAGFVVEFRNSKIDESADPANELRADAQHSDAQQVNAQQPDTLQASSQESVEP